jgi:hypothetical protein
MDAAKSKKKHFATGQGTAQLRRVLSNETPEIHNMLNFIYEDDIKVKDKYFATI